ncbi:MAG TPA: RcnB family protein [Allosphingosinicella sp.]|nr:RcnB family protein [Allosphingosinicella sp.]
MRKLIIMGLMAATILPATPALAQSRSEIRRDYRDLREEQRELQEARRYGDRGDVREERRDVRDARRELREDIRDRRDWGRHDWRNYRYSNRRLYSRGHWRAPFRYRTFSVGYRIAPSYFGSSFWIHDPWRYRLPHHRGYLRWVRHYDDVLLIDIRRGIVVDVIRNFFW